MMQSGSSRPPAAPLMHLRLVLQGQAGMTWLLLAKASMAAQKRALQRMFPRKASLGSKLQTDRQQLHVGRSMRGWAGQRWTQVLPSMGQLRACLAEGRQLLGTQKLPAALHRTASRARLQKTWQLPLSQ